MTNQAVQTVEQPGPPEHKQFGGAVGDSASQATEIERSRAVAEVQSAVIMAQRCRRDVQRAREAILQSCQMKAFSDRAFFSFSRAGSTVNGPSIHFAVELARCWGNIDYGIKELERNENSSEMLSFAWDLETNTRIENVFTNEHGRDTRNGRKALTDLRDIYENNANMGARRLRECILRCLPPWLVEEAKEACHKTLREGGGVPLPQRIGQAVEYFGKLGISEAQLVESVGRAKAQWTPMDLANLEVKYRSIRNGELDPKDAFPDDRAASLQDELTGGQQPKPKQQTAQQTNGPQPLEQQDCMHVLELITGATDLARLEQIKAQYNARLEATPDSPLKKALTDQFQQKWDELSGSGDQTEDQGQDDGFQL